VDHLLQDEGAASKGGSFLRAREARWNTLAVWFMADVPSYRFANSGNRGEGARCEKSEGRKKKGVVGDESMNAQVFFYFSFLSRLLFAIIILATFPLYVNKTKTKFWWIIFSAEFIVIRCELKESLFRREIFEQAEMFISHRDPTKKKTCDEILDKMIYYIH